MKFNRWMEMISGPRNESYSSPDLFRTPGMVPASSGLALGNDTEMTDESRVSHALLFLPFPRVFLPKTMVAYHGTRPHKQRRPLPTGFAWRQDASLWTRKRGLNSCARNSLSGSLGTGRAPGETLKA